MIAPEPITLSDIDDYLEDLTAIAETAMALNLCSRARMAVSAGSVDSGARCNGSMRSGFARLC